jgi:1-acyl-sn-glycerol-3-phosphate acyltransferase
VIVLRSVIFNIAFYLVLSAYLIVAMPTLLMPRSALLWLLKSWSSFNLTMLRVICGLDCEFRGLEKITAGPVLIASKHQSLWETFALITVLKDPTYVLKRELMWIPFFGWCARKAKMIPVDRGARSQALHSMVRRAREEVADGREIIIFPEGTRRAPGAEPQYKYGVAYLYHELGIPCVPVALNSGQFWPRRSLMRYPGVVRVEFLDPIPPGVKRQVFFERLQRDIESATARLGAPQGEAQAGAKAETLRAS